MLQHLLPFLIIIPLLGFIGCLITPRKWERTVFTIAISAITLEFLLFFIVAYQWVAAGSTPVSTTLGALYTNAHYTLSFDFYFDRLSAVFLCIATVMTALVFIFSRTYMHRESGFKRFYTTLFLFFIGLMLIIMSGNFEMLFVGWEVIGITSILLIAFYRDRFLPARNALKVFSVYRIADAFLLAAIWYGHHIFEKSLHFSEFSAAVAHHGNDLAILGLLLLVAALIKSAQFPFSYWLPRAMEGPTTSSAIFYGALSVHMGLFLLLRTFPLWEGSLWLRITIAVFGLMTAIIASSITRVQSSAKTQIAYASITQIGIMFIEVAAGLHWLALLHFISNASLRTYQLLISPSVVSYLVHDQFFSFVLPAQRIKNNFLGKIRATLYVLSIKEWNMNSIVSNYVWRPLKTIGRRFALLDALPVQGASFVLFLAVVAIILFAPLANDWTLAISNIAAITSILFYIRAYATKNSAARGWNLIMLGHLFGALFLVLATRASWQYLGMYIVGIAAAFIIGHACLWYLKAKGESNTLREYNGSMNVFVKIGHLFFVAALVFITFPIGPTFLAQDILLSMIPMDHAFQVVLFCVSYLLMGVSTLRLYTKVFFGSHKTSYHEIAYRSS